MRSKFKLLTKKQAGNVKGGNGTATGWNHPEAKGNEGYNRQLDKTLKGLPCPPPEPD